MVSLILQDLKCMMLLHAKRKRNIRKQRSREAAIGRYNDEAHRPSFQLEDGIDKQVVKSGYPPPLHPRASDTLKSNKIGEYGGHDPSK
jgi:hypothetical protein